MLFYGPPVSQASLSFDSGLVTPRGSTRAPPVPILSVDSHASEEPPPLEAQQIWTTDGSVYFRSATKLSPRHYRSFKARKFLQVANNKRGTQGENTCFLGKRMIEVEMTYLLDCKAWLKTKGGLGAARPLRSGRFRRAMGGSREVGFTREFTWHARQ